MISYRYDTGMIRHDVRPKSSRMTMRLPPGTAALVNLHPSSFASKRVDARLATVRRPTVPHFVLTLSNLTYLRTGNRALPLKDALLLGIQRCGLLRFLYSTPIQLAADVQNLAADLIMFVLISILDRFLLRRYLQAAPPSLPVYIATFIVSYGLTIVYALRVSDRDAEAAFDYAVHIGNVAEVRDAINRKVGGKVNQVTEGGWTPLIEAASLGQLQLCDFLLSAGAHINASQRTTAIERFALFLWQPEQTTVQRVLPEARVFIWQRKMATTECALPS